LGGCCLQILGASIQQPSIRITSNYVMNVMSGGRAFVDSIVIQQLAGHHHGCISTTLMHLPQYVYDKLCLSPGLDI